MYNRAIKAGSSSNEKILDVTESNTILQKIMFENNAHVCWTLNNAHVC